jgi:outer membrane autotransporter protein
MNTPNASLKMAVRRSLLASAALVPLYMYVPAVSAQVVANAGPDRSIGDSDGRMGETVTLDASGSTGNIALYTWTTGQGTVLGFGRQLVVRLADVTNFITLRVDDDPGTPQTFSSDSVVINVSAPGDGIDSLSGLTPNQLTLGRNFDDLCLRISQLGGEGSQNRGPVTPEQQEILDRCFGIFGGEGGDEQIASAISQLGADNFISLRLVSTALAQRQFENIRDRLLALRAGTRGVSLAGINLRDGNQSISGEMLADGVRSMLGGAGDEGGDLLDERFGVWARGNFGTGDKSATLADSGFDTDLFGFTLGADYRFGKSFILGGAVGAGTNDVEFGANRGEINNDSVFGSLYGMFYAGNLYLDAVVNYIGGDYDSRRNVQFEDDSDTVDQVFRGATDSETFSVGLAAGYDFVAGAFTVTPSVSYLYTDVTIDEFAEAANDPSTAGYSLNLAFDEQQFKSSTFQGTVNATYAWKVPFGVIVPHLRGSYVRETETGVQLLGVRFANDPFGGTADPNTPIILQSDAIDKSYLRLAAGASVQFQRAVSAYVEYQQISGLDNIDFQDVTAGLRFNFSF